MAQISKRYIQPKVSKRIFNIFLKSISTLRDKVEIVDFLDDFLTPTEKVMLSKRISIAFLLENGFRHRQIANILKVSNTTVWSVAHKYKYGNGYKKTIARINNNEKVKRYVLDIAEQITSLGKKSRKGGGLWKALNEEIKNKKSEQPF